VDRSIVSEEYINTTGCLNTIFSAYLFGERAGVLPHAREH
jgi:hypothetical protein